MKHIFPGYYAGILAAPSRNRLDIIEEMGKKIKRVEIEEEKTKTQLLKVVPEDIREFLEKESIIDNLLKKGWASKKILLNHRYGFSSFEVVKEKLTALEEAWSENLKVEYGKSDDSQVEVFFYAIRV